MDIDYRREYQGWMDVLQQGLVRLEVIDWEEIWTKKIK